LSFLENKVLRIIMKILNSFIRKWYLLLLLIPSTVIAYIISLIIGFFIANRYHSDYLGIQIMKLVFAMIAPLPIINYWKDIFKVIRNKGIALIFCMLLQIILVGLFWLLISSL